MRKVEILFQPFYINSEKKQRKSGVKVLHRLSKIRFKEIILGS